MGEAYHMTFQVVGWADVFTRQQYRDVILKSHCKWLYSLSDKYLGVVKTTLRGGQPYTNVSQTFVLEVEYNPSNGDSSPSDDSAASAGGG